MKGASNIAYLEKISQEEMEAILTDFDPIEVPALYFLYDFYSLDFLHFTNATLRIPSHEFRHHRAPTLFSQTRREGSSG